MKDSGIWLLGLSPVLDEGSLYFLFSQKYLTLLVAQITGMVPSGCCLRGIPGLHGEEGVALPQNYENSLKIVPGTLGKEITFLVHSCT